MRSAADNVRRLTQEIDKLVQEESTALLRATYLGMTPDEDSVCDERRNKITELIGKLSLLEKAQ